MYDYCYLLRYLLFENGEGGMVLGAEARLMGIKFCNCVQYVREEIKFQWSRSRESVLILFLNCEVVILHMTGSRFILCASQNK